MRAPGLIMGMSIVALAGGGSMAACGSVNETRHEQRLGLAISELQSPQTPIDGSSIPRFVQRLPLPRLTGGEIQTVLGNQPLTLRMCEFWSNVLPKGTFSPGVQPRTRVWGYIVGDTCPPNGPYDPALDTYIGPVIVSQRPRAEEVGRPGSSTDVTWVNELGSADTTQVLAYRYSTDQTLHWADPLNKERNDCFELAVQGVVPPPGSPCAQNYAGTIPAVAHLHGGEQPPEIDGNPEAWFTSNGALKGPAYYTFLGAHKRDDCEEDDHDDQGSHDHHDSRPPCRPSNSALFRYPNDQPAAPLWIHDHSLGTTRLNVHAGLAGAYFIEDPSIIPKTSTTTAGTPGTCTKNCLPTNLPPLANAVPVVLQDRIFDTDGQFFFPADSAGGLDFRVNPQHPYWVPEFIGDTIVVNGKAWPFLPVDARRYQFMLLNGSNARAYELSIKDESGDGPPMYVIATDGGYLDTPAQVTSLVMQPGERYEVIIDFADFAHRNLLLTNTANAPLPGGVSPVGTPVAQILQFQVGSLPAGGDPTYNPNPPYPERVVPLRSGKNAIVRLVDPATGTLAPDVQVQKTRQLTLNEVIQGPSTATNPVTGATEPPETIFPGGPLELLLNNTAYEGVNRPDFTPITIGPPDERITKFVSELPREGATEVWEIINLTADAHPIHLHLVQFQLLNRQDFKFVLDPPFDGFAEYNAVYNSSFPGASYIPGFGPPLSYGPSLASGETFGGNPDVTPFLQEPAAPPESYEAGWKDTVIMYPEQVTRIAVRWAPIDIPKTAPQATLHYPFDPSDDRGYVWHCHILDHEDNDMMRPYNVRLNPASPAPQRRPLVQGVQY